MGNSLTTAKKGTRVALLLLLLTSITLVVAFALPYTKKVFTTTYSINYYHYNPAQPVKSEIDTSKMPPAVAVPVLMYHGVVSRLDQSNTTIENFISQMEMLKRDGYQTISVAEYDLWRQGKFTLPAKPIIITFDDGRKDSYYTTDDVLKKLGFKATIFYASGPTIDGNSFYLTYDELKQMKATGRWEIEAHGRYSHHKIPMTAVISNPLDEGRYLTSKMYLTKEHRLETVDEYKKRVEDDYINNINDLKTNVGVDPHYFAIPLNDYGQQPISNYDQAVPFNQSLIRKYFTIAFIQANNSDDVHVIHLPVYNFKNENPYLVKRIEVENMEPSYLQSVLNQEAPVSPKLNLTAATFGAAPSSGEDAQGTTSVRGEGLYVEASKANENGQIIIGQKYWQNYEVTAAIKRAAGRSVAVLFYYKDSKNYMSFGLSDNSYFLRSTVDGKTADLIPARPAKVDKTSFLVYDVAVRDGLVTCSVNGQPMYSNAAVPISNGAPGIKVWGDKVKAVGIVQSFDIIPLDVSTSALTSR